MERRREAGERAAGVSLSAAAATRGPRRGKVEERRRERLTRFNVHTLAFKGPLHAHTIGTSLIFARTPLRRRIAVEFAIPAV